MNDELERRKANMDLSRAARAEELLSNPLYVEAVEAMQAAMFEQFKDNKFADEETRHELWQRMQLMKQFQGKFEFIVKQGVKARKTLTLLERAKNAIKRI